MHLGDVNHAVNRSAKTILGMKLVIQITTVFFSAVRNNSEARMALKLANGSERKLKDVLPSPFRSVNPMMNVYRIGYRWNMTYATTNGMLKRYPYLA